MNQVDINTQAIIDAINSGNLEFGVKLDKQQETLEAQQKSIHKLAGSINNLAITSNHIRKDLDSAETRIEKDIDSIKAAQDKSQTVIHARIDKMQTEYEGKLASISDKVSSINDLVIKGDVKTNAMWTGREKVLAGIVTTAFIAALSYGIAK